MADKKESTRKKIMNKFAFIFHPHDIPSLGDWVLLEPNLAKKRRRVAERALRWFPPFKRETVTGVKSITGKEIEGEMILWPMVPEQILNMPSSFTVKKLVEAGKLAQDLGCKIVGLGAYAAWIGKKGVSLSKAIDIAVTTGTSYTVVTIVNAILKAAEEVGISISDARVTVIGATGGIGSVTSKLIAQHVSQLNLVARHKGKLEELAASIKKEKNNSLIIKTMSDIPKSLKEADMVIIVTSTPIALINVNDLLPGTVVCDISLPHNVPQQEAERREDILVIDGGVVKPPGHCDFHFNFGLSHSLAYACMAETMILTLEELFEHYSIGGRVSIEKVKKIAQLGEKHGFKLADFKSFGKEVPKRKIETVRKA